jgi:ribosome maturation factor RimP
VTFGREGGQQVLRVTVDHQDGVDLDTLSELSEKISRRLDLEDFGRGRYQTSAAVDGAHVHTGVIVAAGDDHVVVEVDGAERVLALGDITSARTVADWEAELKGSRA